MFGDTAATGVLVFVSRFGPPALWVYTNVMLPAEEFVEEQLDSHSGWVWASLVTLGTLAVLGFGLSLVVRDFALLLGSLALAVIVALFEKWRWDVTGDDGWRRDRGGDLRTDAYVLGIFVAGAFLAWSIAI